MTRRGSNVDTPTTRKRNMGEAPIRQHGERNVRTGQDFTDSEGHHSVLSGSYQTDEGRERLIPHVYGGRRVGSSEANKRARGIPYPEYNSPGQATAASKRISSQLGRRGKSRK